MPRAYRQYSEEDLINAVKISTTIADVCKLIGIKPVGGNYLTVHRAVQKLDLDISHFVKSGWSKGKQLKNIGSYARPYAVKAALARKRGWKCEHCGNTHWLDERIPLECHHVDKDRSNNEEANLVLLCRNCHFVIHGKH
jgi:5-methylcytosine-specific restriction endonuclease McrA